MELKILKASGNRIYPEEVLPATSIVWEERYNDIGKMQAVFPRNSVSVSRVQTGKFVLIDDTRRLMYIYGIKVTDTEVWAYAYEVKALLQKCAMMNAGTNNGEVNVATAVTTACRMYANLSYLATNIMQPADWGDLGTHNLDGLEYYSVYEYIRKCVALSDSGFEARYENDGRVRLYGTHGTDRTASLILSPGLGNVSGLTYTDDDQSYTNRVYAIGDDNGEIVFVYEDEATTGELYSAYLDCRIEFPRPDDMTRADYEEALHTRARMSLIARHARRKLDIKNVDPDLLGVDLGMGDLLSVNVPELQIDATMRVTCIRRTFENGLYTVSCELSTVTLS